MTIRGLKAIQEKRAAREAAAQAANAPKANWFSFKDRSPEQIVRFLDAFDGAPDGLGIEEVEHVSPVDWKRRASCTLESEGRCFACEQHELYRGTEGYEGGWRQKSNVYVNVLVETKDGLRPEVLSRNANSSFVEQLLEELNDLVDEGEPLTAFNYRIKKSGEGTKTSWSLKRQKGEPLDDAGVERFGEDSVLRKVEYDRQASYYGVVEAAPSTEPKAERTKVEDDSVW